MKQHAIPMAIAASVASIISVFATILIVTPSVTQVTLAYEQGRRNALSLRPISWDLEMTCAALWMEKTPVLTNE